MATVTTLRCVFESNSGKNVVLSYPYANSGASAAQVKTLMQIAIANGDIFSEPPTAIVGAEFIAKTTTGINVA